MQTVIVLGKYQSNKKLKVLLISITQIYAVSHTLALITVGRSFTYVLFHILLTMFKNIGRLLAVCYLAIL